VAALKAAPMQVWEVEQTTQDEMIQEDLMSMERNQWP
jgi:hypothetical protein